MASYCLRTPLKDLRYLACGDIVYLSGELVTVRDRAQKRCIEYWADGTPVSVDFEGRAVFHCGPVARRAQKGWEIVSAGPTTSDRMEATMPKFLEASKVKLVIGKGGMGGATLEALKAFSAAYCAYPGGVAALASSSIKEVLQVEWLDLGMPEALWVLRVEDLGPLIVAMDSKGGSLYDQVRREVEANLEGIYSQLQRRSALKRYSARFKR